MASQLDYICENISSVEECQKNSDINSEMRWLISPFDKMGNIKYFVCINTLFTGSLEEASHREEYTRKWQR